jgi:hypothetical protein
LSGVSAIGAYREHTCALTTAGKVRCWGENSYGERGSGDLDARAEPNDVSGLTGTVVQMSVGSYAGCALTSDGSVKCWGDADHGGWGSTIAAPVDGLGSGVSSISTGDMHSCALVGSVDDPTIDGVLCWGQNASDEFCGASWSSGPPVEVPQYAVSGLNPYQAVVAGAERTFLLDALGHTIGCGNNADADPGRARLSDPHPRRFATNAQSVGHHDMAAVYLAMPRSDGRSNTVGGGSVVAWTSAKQDGSGTGVYGQRFAGNGAKLDVEFRLDTTTASDPFEPALAIPTATDFLATWTSVGQGGTLESIRGQRFQIVP